MDNKFTCPVCDENIRYWQEYAIALSQNINPKTGKPVKTVKRGELKHLDDHRGFECCNVNCNWGINELRDDVPQQLINWRDKHFEDIKI